MPTHNQYISKENLISQTNINNINIWTKMKKMQINETRLEVKNENSKIVEKTKLLGVIVTSDFKWEENTDSLVKRAYGQMQLLCKIASFISNKVDLLQIYKLFVRPILEQSCNIWSSSPATLWRESKKQPTK